MLLSRASNRAFESLCPDVLACVLGLVLAARLPVRAIAALSIAIEGVVSYVVRDNLTLNIIMLIHPFQAIKEWQP